MPPARSPLAQPPRLAVALAQADMVEARARAGKDYGTVLVPEGLLASVLEVRSLIKELNALDLVGASVRARARPWRLRAFCCCCCCCWRRAAPSRVGHDPHLPRPHVDGAIRRNMFLRFS